MRLNHPTIAPCRSLRRVALPGVVARRGGWGMASERGALAGIASIAAAAALMVRAASGAQ